MTTWPFSGTTRSAILCRPRIADLRWIQDRRAHERPKDATVGDGERATLEILERQRAVLRALGEVADGQFDLGEALGICVADDGDDEAAFRADRDADVVVVLQHDLVALNLGIELRKRLQCTDCGASRRMRRCRVRRRTASGTPPCDARATS